MIYTSEQSIKNNKGSFDCFSWGKRIESSVSYRHEIIFQQTNDAGFCAGLSEHNKYRIPLIFFSLIFPQLMPFALTCNILYQGRNFVPERVKISSCCWTHLPGVHARSNFWNSK